MPVFLAGWPSTQPPADRLDDELRILERHFGVARTALLTIAVASWSGKNLTDEHMPAVAAVVSNGRLLELVLARNRISDAGASKLAAVLPLSDSLRVLCLSANRLSDAGAEALAVGLQSAKGVQTLKCVMVLVRRDSFA